MAWTSRPRKDQHDIGSFLIGMVLAFSLSACGEESEADMSLLFKKDFRVLAGRVELNERPTVIEIKPPLEVRNSVQYVTLAIPGAPQWLAASERGVLLTPEGQNVRIVVELESDSGSRFVLDSVSFGRDLMFSYIADTASASDSDLPKGERFVRLRMTSSPAIVANEIRWVDVTNK